MSEGGDRLDAEPHCPPPWSPQVAEAHPHMSVSWDAQHVLDVKYVLDVKIVLLVFSTGKTSSTGLTGSTGSHVSTWDPSLV